LARALIPARTENRAALATGAVALLGGAAALNRSLIGVFYDDGLYAGIAAALGRGMGYVHPHLPGTPAAIHYPPLYPLVLAPLFAAFPVATAGFLAKLLNLALSALAASLIARHAVRARLLGEGVPVWVAPAIVALAALAIPVLAVQSVLFAEPLFGVLLTAAVIVADGKVEAPAHPLRAAALAGIWAALALLTRTIAVAAGAGLPLYLLLLRRRPLREAVAAALPVGLAAVAWASWTIAHRAGIDPALAINYGSYGEVVRQSGLGAFGRSAPDLVRPLGAITLGWLPARWLYYLFGIPALGIGVYGFWLLARRSSIGFTLAGYFAILALWPFLVDRFLWAVLPWLGLAWAAGALGLSRAQPRLKVPVLIVALVMGLGYLLLEVRGAAGRWWGSEQRGVSANFEELLPGIRDLPAGSVLATSDEALVWLYTGQISVPFFVYGYEHGVEVHPTPAVQRAYLERQGVTHILFSGYGSGSDVELNDLLGAYPGWLTVIRVWSGGRALFRVNRGP